MSTKRLTLIQSINEIRKHIVPALHAEDDKPFTTIAHYTCLHSLERMDNGIRSIGVLVKDDLISNEQAIGLLSRTLLTDFLTVGYILCNPSKSVELFVRLQLVDLSRTDKNMRQISNQKEYAMFAARFDAKNTLHQQVDRYAKAHPEMVVDFVSMQTIGNWSINNKGSYFTMFREAFQLWLLYSKYEHIGWYSYDLTRKLDKTLFDERLRSVLRLCSVHASSCFQMLDRKEGRTELKELLSRISPDRKKKVPSKK